MSVVVIGYIYAERADFTPIYGICTILVTISGIVEYILKKNLSKIALLSRQPMFDRDQQMIKHQFKKGGKNRKLKLVLTPFQSVF